MELEDLIQEFSQSRYNDLSIEKGDQSIYLRRGATKIIQNNSCVDSPSDNKTNEQSDSVDLSQGDFLKSDRVGIFSSTIKSGDKVNKGDKVGLITAINVPHDLIADQSGIVKSVIVESGAGVAYGMELIELDVENV
ncbi:MAG: hypothetical protein KC646_14930 [Candidatus Cloacimonetes bacterium]|nr:hypothetical protein [Candidatus Cloacimonadota bacterium]